MDQNNELHKVVFEGDEVQRPTEPTQEKIPTMVKWVFKFSKGRVKDQKQAEYILLGLSVLIIIISIILIFINKSNANDFPIEEELIDQSQFVTK